jgi:hypothetical protein
MPPKALPELRLPGICKRTLAANLADTDNIDAAAIKHRKVEAEATAAALRKQHQPSVETVLDVDDLDDSPPPNNPPRKASNILEAADGSDDDDSMGVANDVDWEEAGAQQFATGINERDGMPVDDDDTDQEEETDEAELGEHLGI